MDIESKKLISEVENLCRILQCYCENNKQSEELEPATVIINCIYERIEKLYTMK